MQEQWVKSLILQKDLYTCCKIAVFNASLKRVIKIHLAWAVINDRNSIYLPDAVLKSLQAKKGDCLQIILNDTKVVLLKKEPDVPKK